MLEILKGGVESIFHRFKLFLSYYYSLVQQQYVMTLTVSYNNKTMHKT